MPICKGIAPTRRHNTQTIRYYGVAVLTCQYLCLSLYRAVLCVQNTRVVDLWSKLDVLTGCYINYRCNRDFQVCFHNMLKYEHFYTGLTRNPVHCRQNFVNCNLCAIMTSHTRFDCCC